jgi:hypothetical protein
LVLPENERNTWKKLVKDAKALADRRQLADGYSLLLAGLQSAEEDRDRGEPWAEVLIASYRLSLEEYAVTYVAAGVGWE